MRHLPRTASNAAVVPSKLIRHLTLKHPSCAKKDKQYFQRLLSQNLKQRQFMTSSVTVPDKALEAEAPSDTQKVDAKSGGGGVWGGRCAPSPICGGVWNNLLFSF